MDIIDNKDGTVMLSNISGEESAIVNMLCNVAGGGGYTRLHSGNVSDIDTVSAVIESKAPCYTYFEDGVPRSSPMPGSRKVVDAL